MDRRGFLKSSACGLLAPLAAPVAPARLGIVAYCFGIRRAAESAGPLHDPIGFVEHCRARGAGGVQISLGTRDREYCARLHDALTAAGMFLEGIVAPPRERADLERFDREVQTARACGVQVLRTAMLSGRRYETFRTPEDFRRFRTRSRETLAFARPVVERHQVRLAVENHKDWRAAELAELLHEARSPVIGACVDTGNNLALLETVEETVDTLAPLAFTTHLKDMGVEEYSEGFLLAEVPLGGGFLDLRRIVERLRRANPAIRFNLEMITRDPLRIPCLTPAYWVTLEDMPARRLAAALAQVRARRAREGLARVRGLETSQRVQREDEHVRRSLRFARESLGL
jgi:sugar phosphate isomerase/epimerase